MIISIIIPMGKAAIMLTVWILLMELSENTNAVGSRIRRRHQNILMAICQQLLAVKSGNIPLVIPYYLDRPISYAYAPSNTNFS